MNFCKSGHKITPTTHTRYLAIFMDQHLSWHQHLKMLKQNLSRANGLLSKVITYHQHYWELFTSLCLSHISDMAVESGDSTVTII